MDFNEKAKNWDKDPDRIARAGAFAEEILKIQGKRKNLNALEFGSGTGNVSFCLNNVYDTIVLADTSKGMLEVLEEKIHETGARGMVPYLITETDTLARLKDFDAVFTLLTMHHVKNLDSTFKDFANIMNKGGLLFLGDLMTEDGSFHFRDPEFDGHKGFDPDQLMKIVASNGFEPLSWKIFYVIKREHEGKMKEYPLFILSARKN